MEVKLIQIGNSHGVRLPKTIMRRAGVSPGACLLLDVTSDQRIVLSRPKRHPREGWAEAFEKHPPGKADYPWEDNPGALPSDDKEWKW